MRARLGLGLLLLATLGCDRQASVERSSDTTEATQATRAAPSYGWFGRAPSTTAKERRYELDVSGTLTLGDQAGAPDPAEESRLALSGTWVVALLEQDSSHATVLARLEVKDLQLKAPPSPVVTAEEYTARVRQELEHPLLLQLDGEGRVTGVKTAETLGAPAFALLRSIAVGAQLTRPPAGSDSAWTVHEYDTAGRYDVRYSQRDPSTLVKTKLRYRELDPGTGLRAAKPGDYRVHASEGVYTLTESGALSSVQLSEDLEVKPSPEIPSFRSKSTLRLRLLTEGSLSNPAQALLPFQKSHWKAIHSAPPPEAHQFELDLSKVDAHTSVAEILKAIEALAPEKNPDDRDAETRLQISLAALLRLKASALTEALELVEKPGVHTERLLRALSKVDAPEAQAAVVRIVSSSTRLPPKVRGDLLISLSLAPRPSAEVVRGFEALLDDPLLQDQALLGLGSAAYRLKDDDPELTRHIYTTLERRLAAATVGGSFKTTKTVLKALGNSGLPALLTTLRPYLAAEQGPVRAAAVYALRRVDLPEVDRLLERVRDKDADASVREAAAKVIEERRDSKRTALR